MKDYEKAYKDRQKGKTYKEIAEKYNVSMNTVKSWNTRHWKAMRAEDARKAAYKLDRDAALNLYGQQAERVRRNNSMIDRDNIQQMRDIVEYKKAHRPPSYGVKDIGKMINRISQYFNDCDELDKPYTIAGIALALDISKDTFKKYKSGDMDYLLEEHITINNIDIDNCEALTADNGVEIKVDGAGNPLVSFSQILQKAMLRLEEQAEQRLYAKARVGDIFTLKQYGWTDEKSTVSTTQNNLIIADKDEAERALAMLYKQSTP